MSEADRDAFEASVVGGLEAFASQVQPIEDAIAARCRGADATIAPWCDELWDGVSVVRLRAQHAALLYRAVIAYARGDDGTGLLAQATAVTDAAAQVIARREAGYRADVDLVTGTTPNPTIYDYGYLRQAHTQCYWRRREEQATFLLQNGAAEGLISLPSCEN